MGPLPGADGRSEVTNLETQERTKWPERPHVGDSVETLPGDGPYYRGQVVATFYCNGEGGMHVAWDGGGVGWVPYHRMALVSRAKAGTLVGEDGGG